MTSTKPPYPAGDDDELVPAAGGTFGVTEDRSEFGKGLESSERLGSEAAASSGRADADDDELDVDGLTDDGHDSHDAYTAGSSSGYTGAPYVGSSATGSYGSSAPGSASYGTGANERQFAPTQFGSEVATVGSNSTMLSIIALALAVLGGVALCIPGWFWVAGGVLGVLAIALGAVGLAREPKAKVLAGIGVAGGAICVAVAVATAILVLF